MYNKNMDKMKMIETLQIIQLNITPHFINMVEDPLKLEINLSISSQDMTLRHQYCKGVLITPNYEQ